MRKVFLNLIFIPFVLTACGGNSDSGNTETVNPDEITVINFIGIRNTNSFENMQKFIDTYNEGQGKIDKVYVNPNWNSGEYGQYNSTLARSCKYSVVTIGDDQFKPLALKNYLVDLDKMFTDEDKAKMEANLIEDDIYNRFRMNTTINPITNKYDSGFGTTLYGMPFGTSPHVLFYNEEIFRSKDINIISIAEDKLDEYNKTNITNIMPHGYAEYLNSPFAGAIASINGAGESVYKVFNNRIAMSWEELRVLARTFQKQYNYPYGYMSEWWFNYGFSIGGDCIGWNEEKNNYEFTICDRTNNYLAVEDITVNGTSYKKGRVLHHEDATFLNKNADELAKLEGKVEILPSQYEAFNEFNRLGIPQNKNSDNGYPGYGVAPDTTANRAARFLTGNDCPMYIEAFSEQNTFSSSSIGGKFNMTLCPQYRAVLGGETYQKNGNSGFNNEFLKVIGKEYEGEIYTGELAKSSNGTPIVGEVQAAGIGYCLAIPSKSDESKYEAAKKFIVWACSREAQTIYAESNEIIPNQIDIAMSDEFNNDSKRVCNNSWAGAFQAKYVDIGDYTYFQTKTWIDKWAVTLNNDVRVGAKTLDNFITLVKDAADQDLAAMTLRLHGR